MELARTVVSLGLSARNEAKLKVRQPLRRALVLLPDGGAFSDAVAAEIADELNVKRSRWSPISRACSTTRLSRTSARLGPKLGKQVPLVKERSPRSTAPRCSARSTSDGGYDLDARDGSTVRLEPDDVEVRAE